MKKDNSTIFIVVTIIIVIALIICLSIKNKKPNQPTGNTNTVTEGNQDTEITEEQPEEKVEEFVNIDPDGGKTNISEKFNETKEFDGMRVGNTQLRSINSETQLLADITNTSGQDTEEMLIDVIFYDKDGNKIVNLDGIVAPMKVGETVQLNLNSSLDYANAYDYKIVKK